MSQGIQPPVAPTGYRADMSVSLQNGESFALNAARCRVISLRLRDSRSRHLPQAARLAVASSPSGCATRRSADLLSTLTHSRGSVRGLSSNSSHL